MTTISIPTAINAAGILEIEEFLQGNFRKAADYGPGYFTPAMLRAWAATAEFQLAEGNPPTIEIKSCDSVSGNSREFTVSDEGVANQDVEID